MSTDKHRVAAYIPSEVKEKFEAFKQERGIGDSKALVAILTEFLGVSYQVAYSNDSLVELKNELLSELQKEVVTIEEKLSKLRSELLSELTKHGEKNIDLVTAQGTLTGQEFENLRGVLESLYKTIEVKSLLTREDVKPTEIIGQQNLNLADSKVNDLVKLSSDESNGVSATTLAKRLAVDSSNLGKNSKNFSTEKFAEWTMGKDPDGISWERREDKKFYRLLPESKQSP